MTGFALSYFTGVFASAFIRAFAIAGTEIEATSLAFFKDLLLVQGIFALPVMAYNLGHAFFFGDEYDKLAAVFDIAFALYTLRAISEEVILEPTPTDMTLEQYNDWLVTHDVMRPGDNGPKAVAEFTSAEGHKVFSRNADIDPAGAPIPLKEALDAVPVGQRKRWHGWCAEMGAVAKAMRNGWSIEGGTIRVLHHDSSNGVAGPRQNTPYEACKSCRPTLKSLGVTEE